MKILEVDYPHKIQYYLYNSPQVIGDIFWDGDWCCGFSLTEESDSEVGRQVSLSGDADNCFIVPPFSVHAVYNEREKCTGAHEDTHIISAMLCEPQSGFLAEGLAIFGCALGQLQERFVEWIREWPLREKRKNT